MACQPAAGLGRSMHAVLPNGWAAGGVGYHEEKGFVAGIVGGASAPNCGSAVLLHPAAHLPRLVAALRRAGRSYVIVREEGYLKGGLKRRVLSEIGLCTHATHPINTESLNTELAALAAPLSGVRYVP